MGGTVPYARYVETCHVQGVCFSVYDGGVLPCSILWKGVHKMSVTDVEILLELLKMRAMSETREAALQLLRKEIQELRDATYIINSPVIIRPGVQ